MTVTDEDKALAQRLRDFVIAEDIDLAADRIEALRAEVERLEKAGRCLLPYLHWTIGAESPGHHPTMPSAVADFEATLGAKP